MQDDMEKPEDELISSETDEPSSITIEDQIEVEQGNLDKHVSRKSKYRKYHLCWKNNGLGSDVSNPHGRRIDSFGSLSFCQACGFFARGKNR